MFGIYSLFEDDIVHRARLPSSRDAAHAQSASSQHAWYPPSPLPRPPTPTPRSLTPPAPQQPLSAELLECKFSCDQGQLYGKSQKDKKR